MAEVRAKISKKNKYYLSPHAFYSVYHYALQYNEWKEEYNSLFGLKAMDYSTDRVSTGGVGDPTASAGERAALLGKKIDMIDSIVHKVAPEIESWLLKAVTNESVTYAFLRTKLDLPCGKNYFYQKRREFYYELNFALNIASEK